MNNNLMFDYDNYHIMANAIRALSIDAIEQAGSGHPGLPLGMADVVTVLYSQHLKFNPDQSKWINRDRFVMSAGHGSMLLYALLYLTNYKDISLQDIKDFRTIASKCAGHPEFGKLEAIEATTGPLGQGLANGVGMAIAEQMISARFGKIIDYYSFVLVGDGCLMEGISYEAVSLAGHLALDKLIVIFDDNNITIDGNVSLVNSENIKSRFEAANWHVQTIDGHNYQQIDQAIIQAKQSSKPSLIACKTIIGYGAPTKAGTAKVHGSPLGTAESLATKANLKLKQDKFYVEPKAKENWQSVVKQAELDYQKWLDELNQLDENKKTALKNFIRCDLTENLNPLIQQLKQQPLGDEATRVSSQKVIELIANHIPQLIGGSADLTASNLTKASYMQDFSSNNRCGSYINYGIREHAMAAIMNGLALSNLIAYGGSFLVFSDYMRPSIRLAALMKIRVIYVLTHDSIGLGEDGPTHQPIEQLASLRAIPGLLVFRPADMIEVIECWQLALLAKQPSILALTRQPVKAVRVQNEADNLCEKGAYVIAESNLELAVTIIATGSEVSLALQMKECLEQQSIGSKIISMVCWQLFDKQSQNYRQNLLDEKTLKVALEAGSSLGWHKYIGTDGIFIGIDEFGESGKFEDLYQHFNITIDYGVEQILKKLKGKL